MVLVILEKYFKIKDNGRDYKYKRLEGARFLPRNILSLPLRHHFVMVKGGEDGKGARRDAKGPQQSAENRTRSSLESLRGRPQARREGLHRLSSC